MIKKNTYAKDNASNNKIGISILTYFSFFNRSILQNTKGRGKNASIRKISNSKILPFQNTIRRNIRNPKLKVNICLMIKRNESFLLLVENLNLFNRSNTSIAKGKRIYKIINNIYCIRNWL